MRGFSQTTAYLSAADIVERTKKEKKKTTFPPSVVTANRNNLLHSTCELKAAALRGEKKKMKPTMVLCLVVDENFRTVTELSQNVYKSSNAPAFVFLYVLPAIRGSRNRSCLPVEKFFLFGSCGI